MIKSAGFFEKKKKNLTTRDCWNGYGGGDSFSLPAAPVTKIGTITPAGW